MERRDRHEHRGIVADPLGHDEQRTVGEGHPDQLGLGRAAADSKPSETTTDIAPGVAEGSPLPLSTGTGS